VRKVIDWLAYRSLTEAKGFIGICVYYRIWIAKFLLIAEPIFRLSRSVSKTPAKAKGKGNQNLWSLDGAKSRMQL
jgi:hypothetical protein